MPLFDDRVRDDDAYMRTSETTFEFLDRVSRPELASARGTLGAWFERWPKDIAKSSGRASCRTTSPTSMEGSWELYLHELHARLGFDIVRDPDLPGVRTHPDFLLRRGSQTLSSRAGRSADACSRGNTDDRHGQVRLARSLRSPRHSWARDPGR